MRDCWIQHRDLSPIIRPEIDSYFPGGLHGPLASYLIDVRVGGRNMMRHQDVQDWGPSETTLESPHPKINEKLTAGIRAGPSHAMVIRLTGGDRFLSPPLPRASSRRGRWRLKRMYKRTWLPYPVNPRAAGRFGLAGRNLNSTDA